LTTLPFRRSAGLLVTAAVVVAGSCRHVQPAPARWALVNAAPDVAFVVGEVRSTEHRRPLESARLRLVDSTGTPRDSTLTDPSGTFVLGPVPPGSYSLEARAFLHRVIARPLALQRGAVDTVRLRLTYDDAGVIWDCVGPERPDGTRGFGAQFCRP
jgi:hypothetical protein